MTWTDLTENWTATVSRLLDRFPHADRAELLRSADAPEAVVQHVADSHHLTLTEAREEMADWAFIQSLARDGSAAGVFEDRLFAAE